MSSKTEEPTTPSRPTSAAAWKKSTGHLAEPVKVPSGNTALIRLPGVDTFFQAGLIPNSLQKLIMDAVNKGQDLDVKKLQRESDSNPELLRDIIRLTNAVVVYSCVEPPVHSDVWTDRDLIEGKCTPTQVGQPISVAERDRDTLYVDEVKLEDRMFIMQLAFGGTRDLEQFRKQFAGGVESVPSSPKRSGTTKRTGGAKR